MKTQLLHNNTKKENGIAASRSQFLHTSTLNFCPLIGDPFNGVITVTTKQNFHGNLYLTLSCSRVSIGISFNYNSFAQHLNSAIVSWYRGREK